MSVVLRTRSADGPVRKTRPLILACLLALGACGGAGAGADGGGGGGGASGASGEFPMTVENCGRKVTFDKRPERVLTIGGLPATLIVAAGAGDKITAYAKDNRPYLGPAQRVVDSVQQIGRADDLSREAIIGARPDVIISSFALNGFTPEDLAAAGIKTMFVSGFCHTAGFPVDDHRSRFEVIYSDIETYGRLFGTTDIAAKAVPKLRTRVAAVTKQFAGTPERSAATIAVQANGSLGTYGNQSMQHEQMKILGLRNVFGDRDGRYLEVNSEEIIARNPDVIIAIYLSGPAIPTDESARQKLLDHKEFANVAAIRNGDVLAIVSAYTIDSTTLAFEGLERLAKQLTELN